MPLSLNINNKTQFNGDELKLALSMLMNYNANKPFDNHVEYNNFKLNDPQYLNALGILSNKKEFMYIVQSFVMHYSDKVIDEHNQDKFTKTSVACFTNIKII